jgi:voltage-gated potassium channel
VHNLAAQLLLSTVLVSATVVMHLIGLGILRRLVRLHLERFLLFVHLDRVIVPMGVVLGLFVVHGAEIWLYALTYRAMGLTDSLEEALFISTSSYSTIGEAAGLLPANWRLVGVLEGVNGMLLIGWSTAFLFQLLDHIMSDDDEIKAQKGAIARRRKARR